jgi:membrane-bound lytic murein transglycosylase B
LKKSLKLLILGMLISLPTTALADYSKHPEASEFIATMVNKHKFDQSQIEEWLESAAHQKSIVKAMSRPAEKAKAWHEYRQIFVTDKRISRGVQFWQENNQTLERAEKEFGVDPAIIVSIIGVETNYGRNLGSFRVIDALATLAFDYYTYTEKRESRKIFFTTQLEHLLLLAREQGKDPLTLKGSYAGAMGWGQFMPNSYRNYAVDYDGDEFADIWTNPTDAIGSVANYFKQHGWKSGLPVASRAHINEVPDSTSFNTMKRPKKTIAEFSAQGYTTTDQLAKDLTAFPLRFEAKYGQEYWLGLHNFYVIGRYNPRAKYAMAVHQLSQQIRTSRCESTKDCS